MYSQQILSLIQSFQSYFLKWVLFLYIFLDVYKINLEYANASVFFSTNNSVKEHEISCLETLAPT
jgi:hypothetical protein